MSINTIERILHKDLRGLENSASCEACGGNLGDAETHPWADMDFNGYVVACPNSLADRHGNINAKEGEDVCQCGCKYWENDKCVDCGTLIEIVKIRWLAGGIRFANDNILNIQLTSWVLSYGWTEPGIHHMDLAESAKYRRAIRDIR
jgi:hypothetical protein